MLTLIQGYKNMKTKRKRRKKENVCAKYLFFFFFFIDFDGIWKALQLFLLFFCFAEESHPIKIERRESCFGDYEGKRKRKKSWLPFRHLQTDLFQSRNNER